MATNDDPRFDGIARLYGTAGLARLRRSHLAVIGLGGVGSWAAEALARSGVGVLSLVDLDDVCVSNVSRQLHALESTVGQPKVEVMATRVREINPACTVRAVAEFFTASNATTLLAEKFDLVIDAIDSLANKCSLIADCRARGIPVIACGAAGGRRDPTAIQVADLAFSTHDRLLQKVREQLRRQHGFPPVGQKFGVDCVYSPEPPVLPRRDGTICETPELVRDAREAKGPRLNCDWGYGSATFVTGAFGFAAAARAVEIIAQGARES